MRLPLAKNDFTDADTKPKIWRLADTLTAIQLVGK
jgi:hypothetical protein